MDILRTDSILSEILEERKSLTGFLDAIFGFLSRKTDFYNIQKTKDDKIGFPPGIKEEILLSCMQKYENTAQNSLPASQIHDIVPPAIEEVEIETEDSCATASRDVVNDIEMFDKSVPKKEARQTKRLVQFAENDYKNGALFEKYCWSQTLKDVELSVILPEEVKSGKHVKLNLKSNYLAIKSLLPIEEELVNGETWDKYKHNDVVWTISDGKLILSFDKTKEGWWDKLLVNEQSIDIKKLDTERPIEEFPNETQRIIEKIQMQHINNEGLDDLKSIPLSKSEQMSRLRQAWNANDSPFKGQPFDPSAIEFN